MTKVVASFDIAQVEVLTDLRRPMLNYLDRTEILKPQFSEGRGRGKKRRYSYSDVVILRSLARLLKAGVGVLHLKRAIEKFRQNHPLDSDMGLTKFYFVTDGIDVFLKQSEEVVEQLSTGQLAFAFVLEIGQVRKEVDDRLSHMEHGNEKLRSA